MSDKRLFLFTLFLIKLIGLNGVNGGKSAMLTLTSVNQIKNVTNGDSIVIDTGKILKRDKRFLLFSGGGISKVRIESFQLFYK